MVKLQEQFTENSETGVLMAELELALDAVAAPEYDGKPVAGPPIGRVIPVFVALRFQKK